MLAQARQITRGIKKKEFSLNHSVFIHIPAIKQGGTHSKMTGLHWISEFFQTCYKEQDYEDPSAGFLRALQFLNSLESSLVTITELVQKTLHLRRVLYRS